MAVPTTMPALPTVPQVTDTEPDFNTNARAFVTALDPWGDAADTIAGWIDTTAAQVATDAATASNAAASAAGSANFIGAWSAQTGAHNVPTSVYHNGAIWTLLNNLADITASEPGVTADWARVNGRNIRVTATGVTAANGDHVYLTASGQTVTLPASPAVDDEVYISVGAFADTVIGRNSSNIMSTAADMTIDVHNVTVTLRYIDATRGWIIV